MALGGDRRFRWIAPGAALLFAGCFPADEGRSPPLDRLYFPVGVALSPLRTRLYVASSDFDLQFNAGSLQVFDLEAVRRLLPQACRGDADCALGPDGSPRGFRCDGPGDDGVPGASYRCVDPSRPDPCAGLGESSAAERSLSPGPCAAVDPDAPPAGGSLLVGSVRIGAFATDVLYRARPASPGEDVRGGRLFIPVRGDATLHYVDVDDDSRDPVGYELDCGQAGTGACDDAHRRGASAESENTRAARLPPEPFGVAADAEGTALLTTHQTQGKVSLFVNDWRPGPAGGPRLAFVLDGLPSGALAVAAVPPPAVPRDDRAAASFLLTFRNSAEMRLVRAFDDAASSPARPFLDASLSLGIRANAEGWNSRGVAIDDTRRAACEADCAGAEACLAGCAEQGVDVFVANRSPASLLVGTTPGSAEGVSTDDLPRFFDAVPVALGASRVVIGDVIGLDGRPARRVFVVCFDSREIFVYDPRAHRVESVIRTGRGPQALAVDDLHGHGYVAHFTDSYVGVVDLDQRSPTYGEMILTIGQPTPPRASK